MMEEFRKRSFGYAHSYAVMEGLKAFAASSHSTIHEGYDFIEAPGEHKAFDDMIVLAAKGGADKLYIDTVKELAGASLAEFRERLTAIENAGMTVYSMTEKEYDYFGFTTAIDVLDALMPDYQKNRQSIEAVALCKADIELSDICSHTGLSEADVFQAVADYKREQEQTQR